jgi:hypothetical protein
MRVATSLSLNIINIIIISSSSSALHHRQKGCRGSKNDSVRGAAALWRGQDMWRARLQALKL